MSGWNHMANMDVELAMAMRASAMGNDDLEALQALDPPSADETLVGRFWHWIEKNTPPIHTVGSLLTAMHHYRLVLAARDTPNVIPVHYNHLKADLAGEMRRIAGRLGITVPTETWPALVAAASFDSMRSRADLLAPDARTGIWRAAEGFFHSGSGGHWRSFFDEAAQQRYDARIASIAEPEIIAWAHFGESSRYETRS